MHLVLFQLRVLLFLPPTIHHIYVKTVHFNLCSDCRFNGTLRSQVTEVIESQFMLDWIEDESLAPVGQWVVKDGFWLEEIPWGVFEVNWPPEWGQGQELVADETWIPLDIQTLTSRQIHLLEKEASKVLGTFRARVLELNG